MLLVQFVLLKVYFTVCCVFIELPYPPVITSVGLSSSSKNAVDVTWTPSFDGNSPVLRFTIDVRDVVIGMVIVYWCLWRDDAVVCVSVALMYCAQTTESIIIQPSPDCSLAILVFVYQT